MGKISAVNAYADRHLYLILPVFSMWRMMKYAEKQRMVMVSEIIICSMSASHEPVPDEIGSMEYTQCTSQKHNGL